MAIKEFIVGRLYAYTGKQPELLARGRWLVIPIGIKYTYGDSTTLVGKFYTSLDNVINDKKHESIEPDETANCNLDRWVDVTEELEELQVRLDIRDSIEG